LIWWAKLRCACGAKIRFDGGISGLGGDLRRSR
jgi:hypothetical protein